MIGFSYPVVPEGKARIRVQLSATHSHVQLIEAIEKFIKVFLKNRSARLFLLTRWARNLESHGMNEILEEQSNRSDQCFVQLQILSFISHNVMQSKKKIRQQH